MSLSVFKMFKDFSQYIFKRFIMTIPRFINAKPKNEKQKIGSPENNKRPQTSRL